MNHIWSTNGDVFMYHRHSYEKLDMKVIVICEKDTIIYNSPVQWLFLESPFGIPLCRS